MVLGEAREQATWDPEDIDAKDVEALLTDGEGGLLRIRETQPEAQRPAGAFLRSANVSADETAADHRRNHPAESDPGRWPLS